MWLHRPAENLIEVLLVMRKVKKMATINVDKLSLKDLVDLEAKVQKAITIRQDGNARS